MSYVLAQASAHAIPLPNESVQCVVTSPPYWGLREYEGEQAMPWGSPLGLESTPELYVEHMVEVFREVGRVLRADGTLWLNLGDSYANDTKWGGSTGGKHAAGNHGQTGIGRQRSRTGLKAKDLIGIPWRVAFALQADGWYLRSDIIWSKPNPMPESVTDRPTKSHEYLFLLTKSSRYYYDADAVREPAKYAGTEIRYGPDAKIHEGGDAVNDKRTSSGFARGITVGEHRNIRTVWDIATQPYAGAHFATFPETIPERCIKAGSDLGTVVLDPFHGSGTTGRVAQRLGRDYVGFDLSREYLAMSLERVDPITAVARDEGNPQLTMM